MENNDSGEGDLYTDFNPANEPLGQREAEDMGFLGLGIGAPPVTEEEWEDDQGMVVPLPDEVAQSYAERRQREQRYRIAMGDLEPEDVYTLWELAELDKERTWNDRPGVVWRPLSFDQLSVCGVSVEA